jgi:hypothetical protein
VNPEEADRLVRSIVRRIRVVGWIASLMGAAAVFIAIGFLIPIFHDPAQRTTSALRPCLGSSSPC